ncbi:hypothetical protein KIN20_017633 [Parelaphostrongylus tenuis]|uniref:Uncharacterized protein n=1 Tax=Parelaphostrongylus tenuis TaxID=148309 RepID=A0AAD5QQX2_PARTN|nr:hypothetical protein KIN20_017633 [Parelaphostrongylus tenuis]
MNIAFSFLLLYATVFLVAGQYDYYEHFYGGHDIHEPLYDFYDVHAPCYGRGYRFCYGHRRYAGYRRDSKYRRRGPFYRHQSIHDPLGGAPQGALAGFVLGALYD